MKYQCICRFVITGDVPGSWQRLLNQYVYAGSRANHAPTKSPSPYWQARLNSPYPAESPTQFLHSRLKSHLNPPRAFFQARRNASPTPFPGGKHPSLGENHLHVFNAVLTTSTHVPTKVM